MKKKLAMYILIIFIPAFLLAIPIVVLRTLFMITLGSAWVTADGWYGLIMIKINKFFKDLKL